MVEKLHYEYKQTFVL